MTDKEKVLLGHCIQKYRKERFTQDELVEGICSKYTLSRLENEIICKSKTYHQLLNKLGFYYEDNYDMITIDLLFKDILSSIIINDIETILSKVERLSKIVEPYENHIYILEIKQLVSYLKSHYLYQERISFEFNELSILPYCNKNIRICIKHVLCENMFFHNANIKLESFIQNFDMKEEKHILTDFFRMVDYQYRALILKSHTIFENHSHYFNEENKDYQKMRFLLVYSLGFINKNESTAIAYLKEARSISESNHYESSYFFLYFFAKMILYTKTSNLILAYQIIEEGIIQYPRLHNHFLPYFIIFSLLLKKKVDKKYLVFAEDVLANICIHLYHFTYTNPIPEKDRLIFINRYLPKYMGKDNIYLPLIGIVRRLVLDLVESSYCYRSGLVYDTMVKKYTNEKEYQL